MVPDNKHDGGPGDTKEPHASTPSGRPGQMLVITRPDDWHLHLRDEPYLAAVLPFSAHRFARAIIMPNLNPPVTTTAHAEAYSDRILSRVPADSDFQPLMSLYLTDDTTAAEIATAKRSGIVYAVKYYPVGTTTHSQFGVTDPHHVYKALSAMEAHGLPLLVHGESADAGIDIFDREAVFIERVLVPLTRRFPHLRIVLEHISTSVAVDFVRSASPQVAATVTAHHLLLERSSMFDGGLRPHHYCVPVLKKAADRRELVSAVTSGNPKFFLGTDSAPHAKATKESSPGRPGIFTAHAAIELYAECFATADALDRLEAFASFHGADFYGLPRNRSSVTLVQRSWTVPETLPFAEESLVPFRAGGTVLWCLAS
jgi:dihydroorotase